MGRRSLLADHRFRQMYIQDLGHEEPTILLTNEWKTSPKALITRYAQRMLIENSLSDAVRFFHMNALSSAVGLKVDFDMALLVMATRCSIFGTFSGHNGQFNFRIESHFRRTVSGPNLMGSRGLPSLDFHGPQFA